MVTNEDPSWLKACADDEHGIERRCACGAVLDSHASKCAACDPQAQSLSPSAFEAARKFG